MHEENQSEKGVSKEDYQQNLPSAVGWNEFAQVHLHVCAILSPTHWVTKLLGPHHKEGQYATSLPEVNAQDDGCIAAEFVIKKKRNVSVLV